MVASCRTYGITVPEKEGMPAIVYGSDTESVGETLNKAADEAAAFFDIKPNKKGNKKPTILFVFLPDTGKFPLGSMLAFHKVVGSEDAYLSSTGFGREPRM
jgi:hypothetical protein